MSSYTQARTASDVSTASLLGLPEQNANPPASPGLESFGFAQTTPDQLTWERKFGPAEVSYYLPARSEGVNDMYVSSFLRFPLFPEHPSFRICFFGSGFARRLLLFFLCIYSDTIWVLVS